VVACNTVAKSFIEEDADYRHKLLVGDLAFAVGGDLVGDGFEGRVDQRSVEAGGVGEGSVEAGGVGEGKGVVGAVGGEGAAGPVSAGVDGGGERQGVVDERLALCVLCRSICYRRGQSHGEQAEEHEHLHVGVVEEALGELERRLQEGNSVKEMFGSRVLALLVVAGAVVADKPGFIQVAPSYGAPAPSYGAPPSGSYGPPPEQCYPKEVWKTMTKDVQGTSMYYETKTNEVPTTIYAYITETKVAPKTIILYSTMTAYAEPNIYTETKVLYDTKMVTVPVYMTESAYGYNTASEYFTETKGVYVTKTITQSYPMTNYVTHTGYETKGYYVTQTKVQNKYATQTVKNPYYVTRYATETKQDYVYNTVTKTVNQYVTMSVYHTVPEYHTVTKCEEAKPSMMYGYGY